MHPGVGWSHCIIWGWNKTGFTSLSSILWEGQDSGKFLGKFQWVPKTPLSPCFYSVSLCPFAQLSSCPQQLWLKTCNMAFCCDFLPNTFKQLLCFKVNFTESLRQWRDLALKQHDVKLPGCKIEHESPIFQIFWSAIKYQGFPNGHISPESSSFAWYSSFLSISHLLSLPKSFLPNSVQLLPLLWALLVYPWVSPGAKAPLQVSELVYPQNFSLFFLFSSHGQWDGVV